jgi:hypothetical protein
MNGSPWRLSLAHPPGWHKSLTLAHLCGTPVAPGLWPQLPGRPGPLQQEKWGMMAAPRAEPRFFQFLIPVPQVAAWGDSGTDALCLTQIQPPGQSLSPQAQLPLRLWGQEVRVAIHLGSGTSPSQA